MYHLLFFCILYILNSSNGYFIHKNVFKTKLFNSVDNTLSDTTPYLNSLLLSSIFDLENIARSRGGDKYYCYIMNKVKNIELIIYIPQIISRFINNTKIDSPHEKIKISIYSDNKEIYTEPEGINRCECQLDKAAAKSGGDRYSGEINGEIFTFYLPQQFSRSTIDNSTIIKNLVTVSFQPIIIDRSMDVQT